MALLTWSASLTATSIHAFEVTLADTRRGVYESIACTLARHPSETPLFLATRLLAWCLEYEEGIAFSRGGLSDPDEPALSIRDATGVRTAWIEVGIPAPERVHRASKACDRVSIWPHRDAAGIPARFAGHRIHRASDVEIHSIDPELLGWLAERLGRRTSLAVTAADDELYLELGAERRDGRIASTRAG